MSNWKDRLVNKIWHNLLENCQEAKLTIGDAYRMKSGLFEDVTTAIKERDEELVKMVESMEEEIGTCHTAEVENYKWYQRMTKTLDDIKRKIEEN